jgi:hypothetical protein
MLPLAGWVADGVYWVLGIRRGRHAEFGVRASLHGASFEDPI